MAINEELYFGFEQSSDEAQLTTSPSGRPAGGGTNVNYYTYSVVRSNIPATFEQSKMTYRDANGQTQIIQTSQIGVVGSFCMEENSWGGAHTLYTKSQTGICIGSTGVGGGNTGTSGTSGASGGGGNVGGGNTGGPTQSTIKITLNGASDSIIIKKNNTTIEKLKSGLNTINSGFDSTFNIASSDISTYLISNIEIKGISSTNPSIPTFSRSIKGEPGESLSLNLKSNAVENYDVVATVILTTSTPNSTLPTISVIPPVTNTSNSTGNNSTTITGGTTGQVSSNSNVFSYNLNSKIDFQLPLRKTLNVSKVTGYLGNENYDYLELEDGKDNFTLILPFFAFKRLGQYKFILTPFNSNNGAGNNLELVIDVVDDIWVGTPDITNIKWPTKLIGPDYVGTDISFDVSWDSVDSNFVRIYAAPLGNEINSSFLSSETFTQVAPNGKIKLSLNSILNLNKKINADASSINFRLILVPYNTTGRQTVIGKAEILPIQFIKGNLQIPRELAINRIAEAFTSQLDDKILDTETSKYLTHTVNLGNGNNKIISSWVGSRESLILKLYEPLPANIQTNQQVWISKLQSNPIIETVTLTSTSDIACTPLKGPNFTLDIDNGIPFNTFEELTASGSYTSNDIINKYLETVGIDTSKLSIPYVSDSEYAFSNFVNFSSAEERVNNFFYKVQLIEQYKQKYEELSSNTFIAPYENIQGTILAQTTPTHPFVLTHDGAKMVTEDGFFEIQWEIGQFYGVAQAEEAKKYLDALNGLINALDGFEKFLYSDTTYISLDNPATSLAYPKEIYTHPITGVSKYVLKSTTDSSVTTWYNTLVVEAAYYDRNNVNSLSNNVPEFIKQDSENNDFIVFLDMVGQHFDILWTYIGGIKNTKLLEDKQVKGISNDMVQQMLKSLGWENKRAFNSSLLWEYAFGTDKEGYPKYGMSLEAANNEVWRRILNNLPYLLKHKGTARAMKAIMACYGIPQSMLTIMEFGGPQDPTKGGSSKFTFDDRTAALFLTGSLNVNGGGSSNVKIPWHTTVQTGDYPNCVEFRILPSKVPTTKYALVSGSEWSLDLVKTTGSFGKLELNFGGDISNSTYFEATSSGNEYVSNITGSPFTYNYTSSFTPSLVISSVYYSGEDGVYAYGPDLKTGSLDFPISTENYSNVLINRHNNPDSSSWFEVWYATGDGQRITTFVSMSIQTDDAQWETGTFLQVGGDGYEGTLDEFRLWEVPLKKSKFENHTLFPDAINGNSYTASTADLIFRLDFEYPINLHKGTSTIPAKSIKNVSINLSYGEDYAYANNMYSASSYPYQYIPYDRTVTADVPSSAFSYSNKIRFESQEMIGDLSYKQRATKKSFDRAPIDSSRLGLFFSPIKELNMDILKAFGDEFNIDNYIGAPDDEYKSTYSELDTLRHYYFERLDNRDIYEYIQLVRYIDKSLFDVLDDLAPGRAKVSKGLLIEPHFLERSKTQIKRPDAGRGDYDGLIDTYEPSIFDSTFDYEETTLDAINNYELNSEIPNYETLLDTENLYAFDAESSGYDTLIDYFGTTQTIGDYPTLPPTGSVIIECPIGATLTGEVFYEYQQIGMDKNSLSNAGFGLYAKSGTGIVTEFDEIFGNHQLTGSRKGIFLVKEQFTKRVKTQLRGYPTTRSLTIPNEQVYYEYMPTTEYKYKVVQLPFTGSISLGTQTVEVQSLNGTFLTHYRFVNNLSEGLKRSFWKGSTQTTATTPDGLPAVETFTTNPNILRVAKTGRGSGEPILEVD
jgi:hypothetical protein